jgi:hypothetical protein
MVLARRTLYRLAGPKDLAACGHGPNYLGSAATADGHHDACACRVTGYGALVGRSIALAAVAFLVPARHVYPRL